MADIVDRIRKELEARIEQLRPLVAELERLQRAAAALARSVPGRGARVRAGADAATQARQRAAGTARASASAPRQRRASVPPAPRPGRPRTPSPTRRSAAVGR